MFVLQALIWLAATAMWYYNLIQEPCFITILATVCCMGITVCYAAVAVL